jgi:hypothetical protein
MKLFKMIYRDIGSECNYSGKKALTDRILYRMVSGKFKFGAQEFSSDAKLQCSS